VTWQQHSRATRLFTAAAAVLGLTAAVAYSSWPVGVELDTALSLRHSYVSELGARDQPYQQLFNGLDVLTGACVVVLAYALYRRLRNGRLGEVGCLALAVFGLGDALAALLPLDCAPSLSAGCAARENSGHGISWHDRGHTIASVTSMVALLLSIALLGWALRRAPRWRWPARVWLVVGPFVGLLTAYVAELAVMRDPPGLAERAMVTCFSLWVLTIAATLLVTATLRPHPLQA